MSTRKIPLDYDPIAAEYNQRYLHDRRQGTLKALRRILSEIGPQRVLEVGCGTCHWLAQLHHPDLACYGIDRSFGMLKQAQGSMNSLRCQGLAECLPIKSQSLDFIYCVNALHHFEDAENFFQEAKRVLKPGGTLAMIGMDPSDTRNRWYIYDFFRGTLKRDLARFPAWDLVTYWLNLMDFEQVHLEDVEFINDPKTKTAVLQDPFLSKNACSQLALLSQDQYQEGLAKLRAHVNANHPPGYRYQNTIILSMLTAKIP